MNVRRPGGRPGHDPVQHHRDWLALVEVDGPFLSLPVLRETWPALDAIEPEERDALRRAHGEWRADMAVGQRAWVEYVLGDLLGWSDDLRFDGLDPLAVEVPEHDTTIVPAFVLIEPDVDGDEVKPDATRLLGVLCAPGTSPTARIRDSAWAATPVDRLAQLCRHHGIELGLATDGRWWALVWAPRGGGTSTTVFDAVAWPEAAERDVVRAFRSLLGRHRFFGVPDAERLIPLLRTSLDRAEDITEALGVQVRQAVELLVAAFGRADVRERQAGQPGLEQVSAHEVYRGAVSVMMRVVFLLFAEERGLLPSDNELYLRAYSAVRLGDELKRRADEGSEEELESSTEAWHRLLALFAAVYAGVDHPRLRMHAHDGSLFDPDAYPWMSPSEFAAIDDRTVLRMLKAVQYVEIGRGRSREPRKLTFRQLDVEQIGYVYEGLLSFEGLRADGVMVGLVGKEGLEEEVSLAELEDLASRFRGRPLLAGALAEKYKASGIGSAKAMEKRLAPLDPVAQEEARKKLLAVTDGDYPLAERLLPYVGLLRLDLRELPVVILPGALYVTESSLRKNTGTHYTPRFLAEEVVEHALEPLLYHHGPLQTADRSQWTHKSSAELLELKVADIACGSAAFLVAAARYLGRALVDAWVREGKAEVRERDVTRAVDAEDDPLDVEARRQVIEHCLYGVDINPMAVEMAKLSLWLVSMDPRRPFTFLDDRVVAGDSLLGITSLEQLEYLHLDPKKARELQEGTFDWTTDVGAAVAKAAAKRREIVETEFGDDPIAALRQKDALLAEVDLETRQLHLLADLVVGAALAGSVKWTGSRDPHLRAEMAVDKRVSRDGLFFETVALADKVVHGTGMPAALQKRREWLATDRPDGAIPRQSLHWPLAFPEVFESGGFDAVVGNPPFLGGLKIRDTVGEAYKDLLVESTGRGVRGTRGTGDLAAYFVLRAHVLVSGRGQVGLLATNTLTQGDTRTVGLDQVCSSGVKIRRSVRSEPWPSRSAALEYCIVWTTTAPLAPNALRQADGVSVQAITPSLEPASRVLGNPVRLSANRSRAFQGFNILGAGFLIEEQRAKNLVLGDPRYAEVLFPYLSGEDINSRYDCSASRWVINFHDWPEMRARTFVEAYEQVRLSVRPERLKNKVKSRREKWWWYSEYRRGLVEATAGLGRVVVITVVSKVVIPVLVRTEHVFSHGLCVFATGDTAMLAALSSSLHHWWALSRASTLETRVRYTPSDVFETFPLPDFTESMRLLGDRLDTYRRDVMLARQTGLTKTYNLVFDPTVTDPDVVELRAIHRAIDEATIRAYGWDDLLDQLDHGFHPAGRDLRYTIGSAAQREILDRLLELNHERYAEEVAKGLHDKKARKAKPAANDGALF
jgi:hypothetical protein